MRQIGDDMEQAIAARLDAYLASQGIECAQRDADGGLVSVWVLDEDRLPEAEGHYQAFRVNPGAKVFDAPPKAAPAPPPDRARRVDVRTEVFGAGTGIGTVTLTLIAVSVLLTLLLRTSQTQQVTHYLFFSELGGRGFPEILDGQVWRLVTPIFLHGGWLHLIVNMMWLFQLGGQVENNEGPRYLAILVLVSAVIVNTAQYLVSGRSFLGMSGIVYMTLGYVWMLSKYQAGTAYGIAPQTVAFMLVWGAVCLVGLIPDVANTQHVVGLLIGVAWGFVRSGRFETLRRRRKYRRG